MAKPAYPEGDALIPERMDEHTVVFILRAPDPPPIGDAELDALFVQHLAYLRDLQRRGLILANGPLDEQTDPRFRGITIYRVPLVEALPLATSDPMVRAGRFVIEAAHWRTPEGAARFGRHD